MKKWRPLMGLSVSLGIVLLMLSACTQANPSPQSSSDLPDGDGYTLQQMTFP